MAKEVKPVIDDNGNEIIKWKDATRVVSTGKGKFGHKAGTGYTIHPKQAEKQIADGICEAYDLKKHGEWETIECKKQSYARFVEQSANAKSAEGDVMTTEPKAKK